MHGSIIDTLTSSPPAGSLIKHFQSARKDEIVDYITNHLAPHQMRIKPGNMVSLSMRSATINDVMICGLSYDRDVFIHPARLGDCYLVHTALSGASWVKKGDRVIKINPSTVHVSSPGQELLFFKEANSQHFTVRLPKELVDNYLQKLIGSKPRTPLEFAGVEHTNPAFALMWKDFILHFFRQIENAGELLANSRLSDQYFDTMIEMLLSNQQHNYSHMLSMGCSTPLPRHVRRATILIEESVDQHIVIGDLAAQVGVSVRCLQNGFREFLGMPPAEYVRQIRLKKLHTALQNAQKNETVSNLMLDVGIYNFGRFASYYKELYGCTPSETLRGH
ncbi:AraC family transcriptional regulator [Kordiimonas pumila]|uniref:AraC family transcriptional regulator n=1 Tax=Kordiimonas pumila TaxID=2161677 RepID=A0ABV7D6Z0_9PROT|nr:AraC family transcriptional regulator [Kordiimonas pumila]